MQISVEDIVVLINSDRINVTDEKACYSYDVLLPYTLKADTAKAFLDYNIGVRIYIIFFILDYIFRMYIFSYFSGITNRYINRIKIK